MPGIKEAEICFLNVDHSEKQLDFFLRCIILFVSNTSEKPMSSSRAVQPSTSSPGSTLWNKAAARAQRLLARLVVPVSSTDEMSDVWKLYRLTPNANAGQQALLHKGGADATR